LRGQNIWFLVEQWKQLKKYRPIILSELSDNMMTLLGNRSEDVIQMLREFNYKIINALNVNISIRSPFNGNILAIPR